MSLQRHLRILNGGDEDQQMDNSAIKVAFATTDRKHVNQHFGAAQGFVIYAVDRDRAERLEFAQFEDHAQDGHEDKLAAKLALLQGCAAVYCQAVGGSAIQQLLVRGVQPVKVSEGAVIERLLQELKAELATGSAALWLRKALARQQPDNSRFDAMDAEGWQE